MTNQTNYNKIYVEDIVKSSNKVEQYLELLKYYQNKLGVNRLTVLMQIGDFYEIYGVELPDGTFKGTLRQVAELCNISVTRKSVCVFKNKKNQAYMAGFPLYVIDKFTNIMVDIIYITNGV